MLPGTIARRTMPVLLVLAACGEAPPPDQPTTEAPSGEHIVVTRMTDEMKFIPEHPVVSIGDTVVWINEGRLPHTSSDMPGKAAVVEHNVLPDGAQPWDSGLLETGEQYRRVFTVTGEYTYLCVLHEAAGMIGHLTVE